MRTGICSAAMVGFLACLAACPAGAPGQCRVGIVTETRRVLREEQPPADLMVKLAAAGNEWVSFQVLLRSDAPLRGVVVEPADLVGPDGAILRAADARLYRQHQLHLEVGTYRNADFKPGWFPDALIPAQHPLTGRPLPADARLRAMPFDLPAAETHGFWVDLYVPAGTKAGVYRGEYHVTADGRRLAGLPVELTVWDFTLPATPTFQTEFGSTAWRVKAYYAARAKKSKDAKDQPLADLPAVEAQCADLASRHHINASPPGSLLQPAAQADGTYRLSREQIIGLVKFIARYHVNAIQVPHPDCVVKDPEKESDKLRAWLAAWDQAAKELDRWPVTFYTYLKDEPNDKEAYQYVQKWGRAIRAAKSVVKVLVVEQTWTQDPAWGDLNGAVDIWCPLFALHKQDSAAERLKLGERVWTYTALCQDKPTPWWHIDYPLLNYRVPAWIAWRYHMSGLLYWGGMAYWEQVDDPWTDPKTYCPGEGGKKIVFNGEGTLVYPGRAAGYDGIAPSLRLKALRDGIEDYEYLAILERLGLREQAEKVVLPMAGSFFDWDKSPAAWQAARAKLAEMIVGAKDRPRAK